MQSGAVDAFFDYPAHPESTAVRVYGADQGLFENGSTPPSRRPC